MTRRFRMILVRTFRLVLPIVFTSGLIISGCAGVQKTVQDVCDVVAEVDDRTAQILRTVAEYCKDKDPCDLPNELQEALHQVAESVVVAHSYCFQEPE